VPRVDRYNVCLPRFGRKLGAQDILGKLLFLLAIALVVYMVLKAVSGNRRHSHPARPAAPEPMVACAHCAVNLPRSEALESAGRIFCGEEHRRLFEAPKKN
jgi:uncharacterized protein